MEGLKWMAWTWPTALFFLAILSSLIFMTIWSVKSPQSPKKGILGLFTTPGDRLFISLLGSAYIYIMWLALTDATAWIAGALCLAYSLFVFRYV